MSKDFHIVAIDGGAGTGKSTTASILSERLRFMHVDTGSHYRTITSYFVKNKIGLEEINKYLARNELNLETEIDERLAKISINGSIFDSAELRNEEVNNLVSSVASISAVREKLFLYQRSQIKVAKENNFQGLVMEGRDIGTVILPDAELKVFLVADQGIREARRRNDGEIDQIESRDRMDSNRRIAPLKESDGSLRIDTTANGVEEVFAIISDKLGIL